MKIKRIITIILTLVLAINTSLCLLNVSINNMVNDKYITDKVNEIDIVDTINNSSDKSMVKLKENLDILYTITDLLNIDNNKIDSIINSKISRDTIIKVVTNIYRGIKNNEDLDIITVKDYRDIVDNNIDYINDSLDLKLDIPKKLILKETLYKIGDKVIKDVPTTGSIFKDNRTSYNLLHILLSNNTMLYCILINVVIVVALAVLHRSVLEVIRPIFNSIIITYFILVVITGIILFTNGQNQIINSITNDYGERLDKVSHILFYISLGYVLIRRRHLFIKKKY